MKLIKDLGKRRVGKRNRRFGEFVCNICESKVERRIDVGLTQETCGCNDGYRGNKEVMKCSTCQKIKPLTDFYKRKEVKSGYRKDCKDCVKGRTLQNKFNVTYNWYKDKLKEQDSKCAICKVDLDEYTLFHKTHTRFVVDHNHKTGKVRGLLCTNCNTAIGHFKENIETLQNAKEYILKYV